MRTTGRTAYTMVEVVIMMLVMGILAAVAAPRYIQSMHRYRVDAAARRIVADLNYVRGRTIMKGAYQPQWVSFDVAADKYHLWFTPDIDHSAQDYWVEFSKTPYPVDLSGASFVNTNGDAADVTVIYDIYGMPHSNTVTPAPLADGKIVVSSGSEIRTVTIDPVTGKASVL